MGSSDDDADEDASQQQKSQPQMFHKLKVVRAQRLSSSGLELGSAVLISEPARRPNAQE